MGGTLGAGLDWDRCGFKPEDVCFSLKMAEQIGKRGEVLPFLVLSKRERYKKVLCKMDWKVGISLSLSLSLSLPLSLE